MVIGNKELHYIGKGTNLAALQDGLVKDVTSFVG